MHGILIVNKPEGLTSFDIVRQVRRVLQVRKVGHGGTLDPLATGVLPVAVGHATRLLEYLMEGEKVYRATMRLGVITDTQDRQGQVLEERSWSDVTTDQIRRVLADAVGEIDQLPPMFSALKHQGQPLYKLARRGIEIERTVRRVSIKEVSLVGAALPEVVFDVTCSGGTYVRTLIHDFGLSLGCGAHMTALQRTAAMPFRLDQAIDYADLKPGLPPGRGWFTLLQAVSHLPLAVANETAIKQLKNGIPPRLDQVTLDRSVAEDSLVAVAGDGKLLALVRLGTSGRLDKRGDFALLKVFHY